MRPCAGDYFEGYIESQKINISKKMTWYETYLQDFKEWKSGNLKERKKYYPLSLRRLFPSSFI